MVRAPMEVATMNALARGIPFRPDHGALRRAGIAALTRTATAHLVAKIEGGNPAKIAERLYPNDRDVALLIKGAVSQTTTTSAAGLLTTLTEYLIASLSAAWAGAALLAQTLQLTFDGHG